jgi:hypothetical protein
MRRLFVLIACLMLLIGCAANRLEKTGAPAVPSPVKVSAGKVVPVNPAWTMGDSSTAIEASTVNIGATGSITEETNTLTFDDGDGLPITLQDIRTAAAGGDAAAIHDNEAGEISAVTAKASPVDGDFLLIEDSAAANAKKSVTLTNLWANYLDPKVDSLIAAAGIVDWTADQGATNIHSGNIPDLSATYQAANANLSTYAGIAPSADVQTLLGYANLAAIKAGLSVDDLVTLSGAADGAVNLGEFTGSTITDNQTIKAALQLLETAVEAVPVYETADATLSALANLTITQGSLIYGTGEDAFSVLAKGTGLYILRMNAGATAPEWADGSLAFQTLDADLSAIGNISGQRGDILYYGAAGWTRLAKGTSGYMLTMGANDPAWAAASGTGDLKADGTVPLTADWDVGNYDIEAKSFTSKKVENTAGVQLLYSSYSTDITGAGWRGPTSASGMADSYYLALPEAEPAAGQVMKAGAPSSHVSTQSWAYPGEAQTPISRDADEFATYFTGANLRGGTFRTTADGTAALPDATAGMNFTITDAGGTPTIEPYATGTDDTIYLNETSCGQGKYIISDGTTGNMVVIQYLAADTWTAYGTGFTCQP